MIAHNEAPRSKPRGITELEHSELTQIFARVPLSLHVPVLLPCNQAT